MKITFLGTSGMVPTKDRNHSAILLNYNSENILIDCGEGTQRQLKIAGISPNKLTKILITHWHGDHVLGLPGLIQTLSANDYTKTLEIYGPTGSKRFFAKMLEAFLLDGKIDVIIKEVNGPFFEGKEFSLEAFPLKHDCKCNGYSFIEKDKRKINLEYTQKFGLSQHPLLGELQKGKDIIWKGKKITANKGTFFIPGKRISFISDTSFFDDCYVYVKDSDVLICESTFSKKLEEKAREYKHLTSEQAAIIAKKAKVKRLILTHFSQRNKDTNDLRNEARKVFKNTECAYDFYFLDL